MAIREAGDYHDQLRALLPPGPAWDAELVPEVDAALRGLSPELARIDARSADLLNEADPATFDELLPDWERVMQLPDACQGLAPTRAARKNAVRQRLLGLGGQSVAYFEQFASGHGYPAAHVVAHRAPRFGRARFGRDHFGTWAAQYMWTLYAGPPADGATPGAALACLVRRAAPAHTLENIIYDEVE